MGPEFAAFGSIMGIAITCFTLLCTGVIVAAAIGVPIYMMRKNQQKVQNLMATGKQGEATILSMEDTGMRINDDPRLALTLEIRRSEERRVGKECSAGWGTYGVVVSKDVGDVDVVSIRDVGHVNIG